MLYFACSSDVFMISFLGMWCNLASILKQDFGLMQPGLGECSLVMARRLGLAGGSWALGMWL